MLERFREDVSSYHRRRWPGRPESAWSRLSLMANSPGLWLLFAHRCGHGWQARRDARGQMSRGWRLLGIPLSLLEWLAKVTTKSDIFDISDIDGGVIFSNNGQIIFGARHVGTGTVIGERCTIGMSLADAGLPEIGRDVFIGPDCVVYGAISIGDGATLLPGTVLTKSVPPRVVMHGNPARLMRREFDNSALLQQPQRDPAVLEALVRES